MTGVIEDLDLPEKAVHSRELGVMGAGIDQYGSVCTVSQKTRQLWQAVVPTSID